MNVIFYEVFFMVALERALKSHHAWDPCYDLEIASTLASTFRLQNSSRDEVGPRYLPTGHLAASHTNVFAQQ